MEVVKLLIDVVDEFIIFVFFFEFVSMLVKISLEVIIVNEKLLINIGSKIVSDI